MLESDNKKYACSLVIINVSHFILISLKTKYANNENMQFISTLEHFHLTRCKNSKLKYTHICANNDMRIIKKIRMQHSNNGYKFHIKICINNRMPERSRRLRPRD